VQRLLGHEFVFVFLFEKLLFVMQQRPKGDASITGRERHKPSIQVRVWDHKLSGPARNGAVPEGYISRMSTDGIAVP